MFHIFSEKPTGSKSPKIRNNVRQEKLGIKAETKGSNCDNKSPEISLSKPQMKIGIVQKIACTL